MSYLVFARKYRPQTFEQVVGQSHVTRTLANAIIAQRVAHAILFAGPRGTGKTTVARILAKAMNCKSGPTAQPCNQCQSCMEITAGNAADVFEIDGASNNSVDQVRELRENLKYMPVHSRFKIYIIDEVHMLSLAAFNALLKTLEEPPEHIMFIFATTEVHKIPITILSRCQRHDLRRIDGKAIAGHMRYICEKENIEIDDHSLSLIAQEASGSMRDGLSLLDHVLACAQGPVTSELIGELLGVVDRKHLLDISKAVFKRDMGQVLAGIDAVWRNGYELKRFYFDLVAHFHHLTIVKLGPEADRLADLPQQEIEQLKSQVEDVSQSYLLQIFDLLFQAEPVIKLSSQPRLGLEMVFLKLFQTAPSLPIETLIEHLDKLQSKLTSGQLGQQGQQASNSTPPVSRRAQGAVKMPAEPKVDAPMASSLGANRPQDMDALWRAIVGRISESKPSLAGFLAKCRLKSGDDGQLDLEVNGNEFTLKNITKHKKTIEEQCRSMLERPVELNINANFQDHATKQKKKKKISHLKQEAVSHPLVMEAMELFDGRVIDIQVPKEE
ncbi:MAG: DNA polymerase III subunit gamma/tau [Desulfobacteraceae bacterium]|jgi:DNA polymerase-3 subunit gamma/tau